MFLYDLTDEHGDIALFNTEQKNAHGGSVDMIWNGRDCDIKTTDSTNPRAFERLIYKSREAGRFQSQYYLLNTESELDPETKPRIIRKLEILSLQYPITIWILEQKTNTLTKIEP